MSRFCSLTTRDGTSVKPLPCSTSARLEPDTNSPTVGRSGNASECSREGRLDLSTRFADSADDLWEKTGGNDGMALFGQMDAIGLPMS